MRPTRSTAAAQKRLTCRLLLMLILFVALLNCHTDGLPDRACLPPHDRYLFCDPSLPLDKRLEDLIGRLTLEEKPWLLTARISPKGNISRLGIPEYDWGANCMHGVQSRCAPVYIENGTVVGGGQCPTSFPNANSLGAAFNRTLWKAIGKVIGIELRALWLQGVSENTAGRTPHLGLDCWSPNINIQRDPRWGRNLESPSEDPYLCGVYGTMHTLGLQNNSQIDNRYLQAVATLKHFDANSVEGPFWTATGEWSPTNGTITRHNDNAIVSMYDLATTYLPAFSMAIQEGRAAGIMCSFNRINGVPSCASEWLLKQTLRREWKFRGYVTSDTGGLDDMKDAHCYTADWNTTVALAIRAGCDVESAMWVANGHNEGKYIMYLPQAVRLGYVDESHVDSAVRNALEIRFRLGLFDPIDNQPFWSIPPNIVHSDAHVSLAKEATAQSFVLLKNDNSILPMNLKDRIALIGPHIYDRHVMLGNYLGEICRDDKSNGCVTSFLEGFADISASANWTMLASQGCKVISNDTTGYHEAIEAASRASTIVFIGGLDGHLEGEDWDRSDISLPTIQVRLLRELSRRNHRIVLVLLHGGMIGLDDVIDHVDAIVSLGYPGPYAGEVLAEVLYGRRKRAWGKTPITWYSKSIIQELNMLDFNMGKKPGRTYRYFEGMPLFGFGFGLNPLTTFELGSVEMRSHCVPGHKMKNRSHPCNTIDFTVSVTNTGGSEGDEVILAYFVPLDIPRSEPASKLREQLFWFERIQLLPGSSNSLTFHINSKTLQLADDSGTPMTFPGRYNIQVTNGLDLTQQTVAVDDDGLFTLNSLETK